MSETWSRSLVRDIIMESPEKRELIAEIDAERVNRWLAEIPAEPTDADLRHLLACLERGAWQDDEILCPVRWVKLTAYQSSLLKLKIAAAIEARGGSFLVGGVEWRSKDGRVWSTLPF